MSGAVVATKSGQKTPDGYYNIGRMLKGVLAAEGQVLLCGTCMDVRGLTDAEMLSDVRRSTMVELAAKGLMASVRRDRRIILSVDQGSSA